MLTPLMKQYNSIKEKHKDSILFFRLGDFYEMFNEDAKISSKVLGITLTSRSKEKDIPMAGVPYHSAASYIAKLVANGYKVAMCEQVSDSLGKIVKREVVKVITPGTFSDPDFLDSKSNNYIVSFCVGFNGSAISYMDLTTGSFKTKEFADPVDCLNTIRKLLPKEILVGTIKRSDILEEVVNFASKRGINIVHFQIDKDPKGYLESFFEVNSLSSFGIVDKKYSIVASASLLKYVSEIQDCSSITSISYDSQESMLVDFSSQENLNLVSGRFSLLSILDKTKSAMGARFLRRNILEPLVNIDRIEKRQKDIEFFSDNAILRGEISVALKDILDFERSFSRVLREEANIRDLNVIKKSLLASINIFDLESRYFTVSIDEVKEVFDLLESSILESNAVSIKEGGIIKPTCDKELEELHRISTEGKSFLLDLEARERERSGIKNLKIGYNKVFGYYIEVSKSNISLVPENYIRKQTIANAERYITEELKIFEEKVLTAKEKICELEFKIFNELIGKIKPYASMFYELANNISYLDFIISLSEAAISNNYVKPSIKSEGSIVLKNSRHPIVEKHCDNFIDNDINLKENEIIILTGPNMSGKSTFMKQVSLIVVMAQMGSFVPASYAEIAMVDKLFTRVGASDDISSGQSTFMVEMNEVANIINNATDKSLVILDEVGRGTSTFDGISIATAITEHLHDKIKCKTIFATHYHELNELSSRLDNVSNFRVEVKEYIDKVVFLKKISEGSADKSYGIEVARLAGLPKSILDRSKMLLKDFVKSRQSEDIFEENLEKETLSRIRDLDLNSISPVELYKFLQDIKDKL
ncbi:MAG TPA: DNA mismatch repair protein MutS [Fusobacteria bacterium]|nr:DNA mismatch repair protein MutS [Fusobacteriota bacterium]|tara:strand:+ start:9158 stop:11617 length:2460 start_codon:yes stop_codon:yes gene_type:complete